MKSLMQCLIIYFLVSFNAATSQHIVESLPGYPGPLPFKLETGYIGVGENEEVQLFYYFIQSESEPRTDPHILWHTGGPGCSALSSLVYENGPLAFDLANFDGSLPSFLINAYSWTKVASIIFLDSPVGTGFSYSNTSQSYATNDTKTAKDTHTFLRKWLSIHPTFVKNRLFVAGDSYGGKLVPMITLEIAKGNEAGLEPRISLKGYIVGNPATQHNENLNERVPYAHRMALISDEYYELARSSCNGEYVNPNPNNVQCVYALHLIEQCTNLINDLHILEPKCTLYVEDDPVDLLVLSKQNGLKCRSQKYVTSSIWANDAAVQASLGIREALDKVQQQLKL